jgi:hypothetical protein
MAMPEMQQVKDAALKYDKPTLARLAQSGQISPTIAIMAGMMRDRIVQSEMKPPSPPTVAQEVMQPTAQKMGLAAAQTQQQRPQGQGLNQVPVPQQMFERQGMASGGIVAFQNRGRVDAPSLGDALEAALARMKQRDPNLNTDYVRSSILQAPKEQQANLIQQLISESGAVSSARVMPASFTEAMGARDATQTDTGAQFGIRAIPGSQVLAQKADAAGNIYRDIPQEYPLADTGSQPGARPMTGSQLLASKADAAGDIYGKFYGRTSSDAAPSLADTGAQMGAKPAEPFMVDPISGTQTYFGYPEPVIADKTQTDTGAADRSGAPSATMARIAAEEQAQKNKEAVNTAKEKPIDMTSIMDRSGKMARDILGQSDIKIPTVAEASKETADLLKASGFDSNLFKTLQADVAKQREDLKGDRKEAMNMRLIEAGLGIMGGESPHAFVNIGKGATPAIKGLSEDIKGLKKAERELFNAERDLKMKENDFALGKAKISQASIDKARDRADKEREQFTRMQGDFAKTMLSGQIQKDIAKASYGSRMTDFERKWAIASDDAKRKGMPMSAEFFNRTWGKSAISDEAAARIASTMDSVKNLDLSNPEDVATYNKILGQIKGSGGGVTPQSGASSPEMDKSALDWANANPNDPRARQIKAHLGVQ